MFYFSNFQRCCNFFVTSIFSKQKVAYIALTFSKFLHPMLQAFFKTDLRPNASNICSTSLHPLLQIFSQANAQQACPERFSGKLSEFSFRKRFQETFPGKCSGTLPESSSRLYVVFLIFAR